MKQLQFRVGNYVVSPSLVGGLMTLVCMVLFIKFGVWQYDKAQQKQAIQAHYQTATTQSGMDFPVTVTHADVADIAALNYQKVKVTGYYLPAYTVLLDNQTENNRVGYHVITPLKMLNSAQLVLVNRGWIQGNATHADIPSVNTPAEIQTITGQVWVPSKRYFTLEKNDVPSAKTMKSVTNRKAQEVLAVMQHMDLQKYQHMAQLTVSPLMIKLDADVREGGFTRNWQVPVSRITTHIGYAFQWFGFAVAALLIYLYLSIKKQTTKLPMA